MGLVGPRNADQTLFYSGKVPDFTNNQRIIYIPDLLEFHNFDSQFHHMKS